MPTDMKQFVQELQKSRGLSIAEVAARLGYKSQTSVARVMQGKANIDSVTRFCQLLKENESIALSDAEADALDRILERKRLSSIEYAATDILRKLVQGDPEVVDVPLTCAQSGESTTILQRYSGMEDVQITVLNCETVPLFGALTQLVRRGCARVEHYVYTDDNLLRNALCVRAVLPLLHEENYFGGTVVRKREELLSNPRGVLLADVMLSEYRCDGQERYDLILFQPGGEGLCFTFPGKGSTVHRMLCSLKDEAVPIRNAALSGARSGYLGYLMHCTEMERDRAVYRIKPDFGIEQIPADAWRRAFSQGEAGRSPALQDMRQDLRQAFIRRQENAFGKKQATHHVLKAKAVWKFVRTGKLSDHFWGFAPLTMAERLETLEKMLALHTENPYYKLHFLKDEDAFRDDEMICYDGMGLSIIKSGTEYNFAESHSECMITHPGFLRIYRNFFLHSILVYNVQPEHKTRRLLLEMIEYCKTHMEE